MVAGGLPTVQVLLDDGTGTFPYDITTYARMSEGIKGKRGRQDDQSAVTAGDVAFTLDNTDGRFSPGSTIIASPSPIQTDQKIRVKLTANAVTVNRYTDFVQQWPVGWPTGGDEFSTVDVIATDAQARAERRPLRTLLEELLVDGPGFMYPMQEDSSAVAAGDASGNQQPSMAIAGSGTPVAFGDTTGDFTGVKFSKGKYLSSGQQLTIAVGTAATFIVKFNSSTIPTPGGGSLIGSPTDSVPTPLSLGSTSGWLNSGFGGVSSAPTVVTDGLDHVGVITITAGGTVTLYLDGVNVNVGALSGSTTFTVATGEGLTAKTEYVGYYPSALSAARVLTISQALLNGFAGESGTARITRLAGYAGMSLGTLDASLTNLAAVAAGASTADALRDVADAEFGLIFIDGTGNLIFHNRSRVVTKTTPDVTIDANFLDEGTQFVVDMQGVLNYFETQASGTQATQVVENVVSENGDATRRAHGRYPGSKTYVVQTDAEALDRANWIVATHAQPAARVGSLVVDLLTMTAAQQAAMLAVEPDTWLRVTGLPGQTPGSTTADFIIQGWSETLTALEWTLTLNATNKAAIYPTAWVLGDSVLGVLDSTTRLYV